MKSTVRPLFVRVAFVLAGILFLFQAVQSVQSHAWLSAMRAFAMVLAIFPLVAQPQLVLRPYPFSAAEIASMPRAITLPAVVGGLLLLGSFVLGVIS